VGGATSRRGRVRTARSGPLQRSPSHSGNIGCSKEKEIGSETGRPKPITLIFSRGRSGRTSRSTIRPRSGSSPRLGPRRPSQLSTQRADLLSAPPKVGQWSDYIYFQGQLSIDKADYEVESVARMLAERLAVSVETLTRDSAAHGAPICYDLFKLSNGSPNLQTFYCVKGNEATLDDPTGSITGWFAYRSASLCR